MAAQSHYTDIDPIMQMQLQDCINYKVIDQTRDLSALSITYLEADTYYPLNTSRRINTKQKQVANYYCTS